jgi:uncharacterized protein YyaL (SSP411 family)
MPVAPHKHTNRLAHETSPYLLQHAHNPVDWFAWGAEALERSKREDKPILLSIGYAACHWCHVMERESFENEDVARVMNEHFVCIKVDREERPDIDDIYMTATVAMTGHGGWPMTVFLTPKQEPFYAGTYFPPDDRQGRPGFKTLLERIAELWNADRTRLSEQAAELTEHVRGRSELLREASVGEEAMFAAATELADSFDPAHGGFGSAPKFPPSASLSLLLRLHRRTAEPSLLQMATVTLDAMKNGGIYDHVAGGFARYSVDEEWLVPHFEKMLYDNAQLARVYLEAFQVTANDEYRRVAAETLDYVARRREILRLGSRPGRRSRRAARGRVVLPILRRHAGRKLGRGEHPPHAALVGRRGHGARRRGGRSPSLARRVAAEALRRAATPGSPAH